MVKKVLFLIFIITVLALACGLTVAQQERMIALKDGSTVRGEILAYADNVYTVRSALGTLQISDQEIIEITTPQAPSTPGQTPSADPVTADVLDAQIAQAQGQLMQDQDFVSDVKKLAEDPQVMQLLSQPDILRAVASRDVQTLESSPAFKDLMNNPKILDLIQAAGQRMAPPSPSP